MLVAPESSPRVPWVAKIFGPAKPLLLRVGDRQPELQTLVVPQRQCFELVVYLPVQWPLPPTRGTTACPTIVAHITKPMRAPGANPSSRPVDRSAKQLRLSAFVSLLAFRSRPWSAERRAEGRGAFGKGIVHLREKSEQRGGSYDGPREAKRLGLGRQDPRGVDRTGGNDRDHGSPLKRSACLCPRLPGGCQRAGCRHAGDPPPRSKPVLPLLLPLERGWLDTPCRGGRAGRGAASCGLLLGSTLFTKPCRR